MTVPPITEADAVKRLDELATQYEMLAESGLKRCRHLCAENAAAIRWALSLTAFPIDAEQGND